MIVKGIKSYKIIRIKRIREDIIVNKIIIWRMESRGFSKISVFIIEEFIE